MAEQTGLRNPMTCSSSSTTLLYLVSFRPACGNSLVLFRRNVTAGLLGLVREA